MHYPHWSVYNNIYGVCRYRIIAQWLTYNSIRQFSCSAPFTPFLSLCNESVQHSRYILHGDGVFGSIDHNATYVSILIHIILYWFVSDQKLLLQCYPVTEGTVSNSATIIYYNVYVPVRTCPCENSVDAICVQYANHAISWPLSVTTADWSLCLTLSVFDVCKLLVIRSSSASQWKPLNSIKVQWTCPETLCL